MFSNFIVMLMTIADLLLENTVHRVSPIGFVRILLLLILLLLLLLLIHPGGQLGCATAKLAACINLLLYTIGH